MPMPDADQVIQRWDRWRSSPVGSAVIHASTHAFIVFAVSRGLKTFTGRNSWIAIKDEQTGDVVGRLNLYTGRVKYFHR